MPSNIWIWWIACIQNIYLICTEQSAPTKLRYYFPKWIIYSTPFEHIDWSTNFSLATKRSVWMIFFFVFECVCICAIVCCFFCCCCWCLAQNFWNSNNKTHTNTLTTKSQQSIKIEIKWNEKKVSHNIWWMFIV